mgnify:FL=1
MKVSFCLAIYFIRFLEDCLDFRRLLITTAKANSDTTNNTVPNIGLPELKIERNTSEMIPKNTSVRYMYKMNENRPFDLLLIYINTTQKLIYIEAGQINSLVESILWSNQFFGRINSYTNRLNSMGLNSRETSGLSKGTTKEL